MIGVATPAITSIVEQYVDYKSDYTKTLSEVYTVSSEEELLDSTEGESDTGKFNYEENIANTFVTRE